MLVLFMGYIHHIMKFMTVKIFFSSISYSSSKAGLVGMTRWLATKYAKEKTSFNLISPAGVFNNHNKKFIGDYTNMIPKKKWPVKSKFIQSLSS